MAASRDSSLLFSLKELEQIEHGRVAKERADSEARRDAERNAFLERERLAREAESHRLEEQERRQRAEEARRREERGRLVAIERAEVERARAEVEARSRVELERVREAHELVLETARSRADLRTYRFLIGASLAAALTAAGFAAAVSAEIRERDRLDSRRSVVDDAERAQHERTLHALEASRALVVDLERQIGQLRASTVEPAPGVPAGARPNVSLPSRISQFPVPPKARPERACGLDGDPLNGCLPSR